MVRPNGADQRRDLRLIHVQYPRRLRLRQLANRQNRVQ